MSVAITEIMAGTTIADTSTDIELNENESATIHAFRLSGTDRIKPSDDFAAVLCYKTSSGHYVPASFASNSREVAQQGNSISFGLKANSAQIYGPFIGAIKKDPSDQAIGFHIVRTA